MILLACQEKGVSDIYGLREPLRNSDKVLLFLPLIFAVISIVMVGSTSYTDHFNITRDVIVQAAAYIIGYILLLLMISIDYTQYEGIYKFLYVFSIAFMLLVYTPLGVTQYLSLIHI